MADRTDPDLRVDERESLTQFLDFQRATMVNLADGLTKEQLATTVGASDLTIAGLLKHLALVEDSWFQEDMLGLPMPPPFTDIDWDADPDWEFRTALDDDPAWLIARYDEACERSRKVVADHDLDALSVGVSRRADTKGEHYSLRWIILHMIEETARHLGHADLIRQAIDGATDL
jgi:uncharacterized damage-inducible protein DinB